MVRTEGACGRPGTGTAACGPHVRSLEKLAPSGLWVAFLMPACPLVSIGPPGVTSGDSTTGPVARASTVPADACIGESPPDGATDTDRSYRLCNLPEGCQQVAAGVEQGSASGRVPRTVAEGGSP